MKNREIKDIINDLLFIISNKLSLMQSKLLFMGITYEIVLRKDLFPRNKDLKDFIEEVYIKRFSNKKTFKDYLYRSRTLLSSSLLRKIYLELDYSEVTEIINELIEIIQGNTIEDKSSKSNKSKDMNDYITEWMKSIGSRK